MKIRHLTGIALICLLSLAGSVAALETTTSTDSESMTSGLQSEPCCFSNPRFTGVCQVTPGSDESCSSILGYLNNPNSVGRAYCGNTKVRGGWAQSDCEGTASVSIENSCQAELRQE